LAENSVKQQTLRKATSAPNIMPQKRHKVSHITSTQNEKLLDYFDRIYFIRQLILDEKLFLIKFRRFLMIQSFSQLNQNSLIQHQVYYRVHYLLKKNN
jgi:hypothetical protein